MYNFAVGCKTSRVEWERQVAEYCREKAEEAARTEEMWLEAAERADRFAESFTE